MSTLQFIPNRVVLTDGAVGTELMKLGLTPGNSTAEWNLIKRDAVYRVAASYVEAGSEIILTNTFGANRWQLERYGLASKTREINRIGAEITAEAVRGGGKTASFQRALVSGCLGPSGKLFVMGEIPEKDLYESFAEQAEAQKEGGADLFTVMTMTDTGEMEIAVRACAATGLPVIASMTYEFNNSQYRTVMGHTPEEAVKAAVSAGACAVGANCGGGMDGYVELTAILRGLTDLPVYIKGNAGLPELVAGKTVYRLDQDGFVACVPQVLENGAVIIGGCCGTGPVHIKKLKTVVDEWNART